MAIIVYTKTRGACDKEILSFFRLLAQPNQRTWDYEQGQAFASKSPRELTEFYRQKVQPRPNNHGFWAIEDGKVVGMAGLNCFQEPFKAHCAELGFGVARKSQRRGIGMALVRTCLEKARQLSLRRVEANCFAENLAAIALLKKAGFVEEGLQRGAIQKHGQLRDVRVFGILL